MVWILVSTCFSPCAKCEQKIGTKTSVGETRTRMHNTSTIHIRFVHLLSPYSKINMGRYKMCNAILQLISIDKFLHIFYF
jgi:hypothetical protein